MRHTRKPTNVESAEVNSSQNDSTKSSISNIPPDAIAARDARIAAEMRGFFWVKEFAAAVGRQPQFISDRCHARVIRTMLGGKPYRIPYGELDVWMNNRDQKPKQMYSSR